MSIVRGMGIWLIFFFRRKRDERQISESNRKNMNHPSHGVHDPLVQRHHARPRCALPLVARPQAVRPRGVRARWGAGQVPYGQGPRGSGFGSYFRSRPQFPSHGDRFPSKQGYVMFFLTLLWADTATLVLFSVS